MYILILYSGTMSIFRYIHTFPRRILHSERIIDRVYTDVFLVYLIHGKLIIYLFERSIDFSVALIFY